MSILSMKSEWCPTRLKYLWNFVVEKESDVKNLPYCHEGSTATVQETGNSYVINSAGAWAIGERDTSVVGPANKVYVTDADGNPGWEDRTHGDGRVTIEWDGTYTKKLDTPGTTSATFINGMCRYWKISDALPTKDELFDDNAECVTNGLTNAYNDITFEGDGWWGRWEWNTAPYPSGLNDDGTHPLVLVVEEPQVIAATDSFAGFDCFEPGVYVPAGSIGAKVDFESLAFGWFKQLDEKYIPSTIARASDIPGGVTVDATLSVEGAAADAKAVGDALANLALTLTDTDGAKWKLVVGTDGTLSAEAVTE